MCYYMWCAALVLLDVVGSGSSHPTTQRPTTATNHIQQNQRSTPRAVTHVLFSSLVFSLTSQLVLHLSSDEYSMIIEFLSPRYGASSGCGQQTRGGSSA